MPYGMTANRMCHCFVQALSEFIDCTDADGDRSLFCAQPAARLPHEHSFQYGFF